MSLAVLGRFPACCAFHCATEARYSDLPPLVAALRRSSREIARRVASDPAGDLSHADLLCTQQRDLFALSERPVRSEEHTSELQSRFDLVCRLLLEKKKQEKELI